MTKATQKHWNLGDIPVRVSLIAATIIGAMSFAVTHDVKVSLLAGWTATLISFTFLEWRSLVACTANGLQARAVNLDRTGELLLPIAVFAACFTLVACLIETPKGGGMGAFAGLIFGAHFMLVFASVGTSWMFVQTAFAVRYAHLYGTEATQHAQHFHLRPLLFPGGEEPDGHDMLHFAVIIGVSTATADINIQSKTIRRLVTLHSAYSYFFSACVLALVINVTAAAL